jgi:hypothetical protein
MGSLGCGSESFSIGTSIWTGKLTASTRTQCFYTLDCPDDTYPTCPPSAYALPIPNYLTCPSYMEEEDFYTVIGGQVTCWGLGFKYGTEKPLDCR